MNTDVNKQHRHTQRPGGRGEGETDRQTDRQMDGRTDGRTDGQTDGKKHRAERMVILMGISFSIVHDSINLNAQSAEKGRGGGGGGADREANRERDRHRERDRQTDTDRDKTRQRQKVKAKQTRTDTQPEADTRQTNRQGQTLRQSRKSSLMGQPCTFDFPKLHSVVTCQTRARARRCGLGDPSRTVKPQTNFLFFLSCQHFSTEKQQLLTVG